MKLSEFKKHLDNVSELNFVQPNGNILPKHFHITEVGKITKKFIDCGGTVREERAANFQLWVANDLNHRLVPSKLKHIIDLSETLFENEDLEIEVEYQSDSIGKYNLVKEGDSFILIAKQTDCLAKDNCGVPQYANAIEIEGEKVAGCTPGGGCC